MNFDKGWQRLLSMDGEGGQDGSHRVGGLAVDGILELGMAPKGKKIGTKGEPRLPRDQFWLWIEGFFGNFPKAAIGVLPIDLAL
jgi:hypothetical protein